MILEQKFIDRESVESLGEQYDSFMRGLYENQQREFEEDIKRELTQRSLPKRTRFGGVFANAENIVGEEGLKKYLLDKLSLDIKVSTRRGKEGITRSKEGFRIVESLNEEEINNLYDQMLRVNQYPFMERTPSSVELVC